jgi:8-oxo-dGTP diphosphatase
VCAVIIRDGRILLTQRSPKGSFPFLWESPGGKIDDGESFDSALKRELDEKLGIEVRRMHLPRGRGIAAVDIDPPVYKVPRRVYLLRAEIVAGTPKPRVAIGLGWFTADELANLKMTPANEARREELVMLVRGEL